MFLRVDANDAMRSLRDSIMQSSASAICCASPFDDGAWIMDQMRHDHASLEGASKDTV